MFAEAVTLIVLTLLNGIFFCLAILRNYWTVQQLEKVLWHSSHDFSSYWSYQKIFWHFWIWDIEKMRNPD